jgi:2-polyprenyl-3-methyl-5-hydroxy-6-metoxy-1,4-benzoquinol methylase
LGIHLIDRRLNYGRNNIAAFLRKAAPFSNIVDLGAGLGADLDIAAEICPSAVRFALETYPPNIEVLKQHHEVISINLEREALPFKDESMDVVMINQVMEHVKEIFWILHEISRVLKVGGHIVIGVPNLASFHNRLLLLLGKQPTVIQNHSAHLRGYTKHDITRMFQMIFPGGYHLEGFRGANFYPFPPVAAKLLAKVLPNGAWSIFFLLKKTRTYQDEFLLHPVLKQLETNFYVADARERLVAQKK